MSAVGSLTAALVMAAVAFIDESVPLPYIADGTLYRCLDGAAYLYAYNTSWKPVAVPGLPNKHYSEFGFRIRPDGQAAFMSPWAPTIPTCFDEYIGKDAWDRSFSLSLTGDWINGPQVLLNFIHWDNFRSALRFPISAVSRIHQGRRSAATRRLPRCVRRATRSRCCRRREQLDRT